MRAAHLIVTVLGASALLLSACSEDPADDTTGAAHITVAAASDLRFAFEELGESFTADTGIEVTFSFGSSGLLREQIINGAPFDLFASANVEFVEAVIAAGRGVADTQRDYAYGRLVLWAPPGAPRPDSISQLVEPRFGRIAIANPDHAPYGLAAQQALDSAGVLDEIEDRLVYGENISDTLRIAESGNTGVGIVALSLMAVDDDYALVPAEAHEPLRQALVVTSTGPQGDAARAFVEHLDSPAGREVMIAHGFALPGDPGFGD